MDKVLGIIAILALVVLLFLVISDAVGEIQAAAWGIDTCSDIGMLTLDVKDYTHRVMVICAIDGEQPIVFVKEKGE